MSTQIGAQSGAVIAVVRGDSAVDVWSIPANATITIDPARGFGSVSEISSTVPLSAAQTAISNQLGADGAV